MGADSRSVASPLKVAWLVAAARVCVVAHAGVLGVCADTSCVTACAPHASINATASRVRTEAGGKACFNLFMIKNSLIRE
jgi:hypothetical protein